MRTRTKDDGPILPPYPNPGALPAWIGRLMILDMLVGIVLLCLHIDWGALFAVPPAAWFAYTV
jgi:hypothetical protein